MAGETKTSLRIVYLDKKYNLGEVWTGPINGLEVSVHPEAPLSIISYYHFLDEESIIRISGPSYAIPITDSTKPEILKLEIHPIPEKRCGNCKFAEEEPFCSNCKGVDGVTEITSYSVCENWEAQEVKAGN